MTVVIDANILIASGLSDEPLNSQANPALSDWRTANSSLIAPHLFQSEITAVLRKLVYQQRITHEQGRMMLGQLLIYPIQFYEDNALLETAYEIAKEFNRPRAYDAQYMALAQRLSCEFWTADERMFNAVKADFPYIRWLGNWSGTA